MSSEACREIARTDPWRSYWGITDCPFGTRAIDLDYDKRTLLAYSKMYDNIGDHPECPSQEIIEDDDMLDGWMIVQQRQTSEKKVEKHKDDMVNNFSPKYQNATEIFLPAQSKDHIKQIDDLNTATGKRVRKQRQQMINEQGQVGVGKLPDEMLAIQNQSMEEFKQKAQNKQR